MRKKFRYLVGLVPVEGSDVLYDRSGQTHLKLDHHSNSYLVFKDSYSTFLKRNYVGMDKLF